jgi:hypothetical protein
MGGIRWLHLPATLQDTPSLSVLLDKPMRLRVVKLAMVFLYGFVGFAWNLLLGALAVTYRVEEGR